MKVLRERTFTFDGEGPYPGYECEEGGRIYAGFTMEQMEECARIQAGLVEAWGNEEYAKLEYHDGKWHEVYVDGVYCDYEPMGVDGMELYFLGANDWGWDL